MDITLILDNHKLWLYSNGKHGEKADFESADLQGADLQGADLPIYCKWHISIRENLVCIGCKEKTIIEWDKWFECNEVFETNRDTDDFKLIFANYLAAKHYYLALQK